MAKERGIDTRYISAAEDENPFETLTVLVQDKEVRRISMKSILVLMTAFLSFSASSVNAATFSYAGKFDGVSGVLTLEQANGTYRASFTGNNGQKGLIARCESAMGAVLKSKVKDGVLKQLVFAFDPNYCVSIEGRQVTMDFKNDKVSLSLLSHYEWYQPPCIPDWQGHQNCPLPESRPVFLSGKLTRQ